MATETIEVRRAAGFRRKPVPQRAKPRKLRGVREWQAEHSISRLFRISITLQKAFDRCFRQFGLSAQEAAALLHCVEGGNTSAGKLARVMGRDSGKITRLVDKLEARGFVSRESYARDRRLFIIKATNKGRRVAPHLRVMFDEVRARFFAGILSIDIDRLEFVLEQLNANAGRLAQGEKE